MQRVLPVASIIAAALALAGGPSAYAQGATDAAASTASYRLVNSVSLGAPDRWDYVVYDAPSHRVYVAHGDRVAVVDGRDGKIVGEVTGLDGGTHGIAISHSSGLGYSDDGQAGQAEGTARRVVRRQGL